jgi:hypothetical protein
MVTFNEQQSIASMPSDWAARILGYSYNAQGVAHTVSLVLAPAAGFAADEGIPLETPADPVSSFEQICGRDGLVVPRRIGFESTAQPPGVPFVTSGESFQVFLSTVGKAGDGTFRLWYAVGPGV